MMNEIFDTFVANTAATLAAESKQIQPTGIGNLAEAKARFEAKRGAPKQTPGLGLVGLDWEDDLPRAA